MLRWFKLFMRKRSRPMSPAYARKMKFNLSLLYLFFAWNAAGLYAYEMMFHAYPMTEAEKAQPCRYYARVLQGEDITVINVSGLTVTDTFQIKGTPKLIPDESEFLPETPAVLNDTEDKFEDI